MVISSESADLKWNILYNSMLRPFEADAFYAVLQIIRHRTLKLPNNGHGSVVFHDNVHKSAGLPDIPTAGKSYGHTPSVGLM
jgi:hypothetical protein